MTLRFITDFLSNDTDVIKFVAFLLNAPTLNAFNHVYEDNANALWLKMPAT